VREGKHNRVLHAAVTPERNCASVTSSALLFSAILAKRGLKWLILRALTLALLRAKCTFEGCKSCARTCCALQQPAR
jgi:hypothetical protein